MRTLTVAALLLASAATQAQAVYKCRDKSGSVEFSSWPCAKHQRTEKAVPAPPDPVRPYVPPAPVQRSRAPVVWVSGYAPPSQSQQATQRCSNAKAWRVDELRRLGLRRTFNDLRRVDDWVQAQCAGV